MAWMQTWTGRAFDLLVPRVEDVCIVDMARGLGALRYVNATKRPLAIAEHSVCMSLWVPPVFAKEALLHDGHEAYINDITTPVSHALGPGLVQYLLEHHGIKLTQKQGRELGYTAVEDLKLRVQMQGVTTALLLSKDTARFP